MVLFWLAPAGIRRFIVSCLLTLSGLLAREPCFSPLPAQPHHDWKQAVSFLCHSRDSRHPYLRTAACPVGGGTFLSNFKVTVGRSLPLHYLWEGKPDKHSAWWLHVSRVR